MRNTTPIAALSALLVACGGGGGGGAVAVDAQAVLAIEINGTISQNLTFPAISAGGAYSADVAIKSDGAGDLIVTRVDFERTDDGPPEALSMTPMSAPFDTLPFTLPSRQIANVSLLYQPIAGAPAPTGNLYIESNDTIAGLQVVEVGTQIRQGDIRVDPANLSWDGAQVLDNQPDCGTATPDQKQRFNVVNSGQDFLKISDYELLPVTQQTNFTVCPAPFEGDSNVIPTGASREWKVIFHPQSSGEHNAFVKIHTSGGKSAQVTLRGRSEGAGGIVVEPRVLTWPGLGADQCGEQNFRVSNTGDLPLNVPQIRMRPDGIEDFYTLSGSLYDREGRKLREALRKGEHADFTVLYCAGDDLQEGQIELHHTATAQTPSPIIIELKGQAELPQLCINPGQVVFSGTAPGESASQSLVVENCGGGFLNVQVEGIEQFASGTTGHDSFSYSPQNEIPEIEPGQFEVITISYARPADQVGKASAALLLSHNDALLGDDSNPLRVSMLTTHETQNLPPVACQTCSPSCTVPAGETVTLDCSCATDDDADGRTPVIGRCEWRVVRRPAGSDANVRPPSRAFEIDPPDAPTTDITLDVPGEYHVELFVTEAGADGLMSAPSDPIHMVATVP